jgi:hypothetical protein
LLSAALDMPSTRDTFRTLLEQRRRRRATLPWAELEADAARRGCAVADIFHDRAGRPVPGLPGIAEAVPAPDPEVAPTRCETPEPNPRRPTHDTWGRTT